jgi:hypothetical protein
MPLAHNPNNQRDGVTIRRPRPEETILRPGIALAALLLLPVGCGVEPKAAKTANAGVAVVSEEASPETFALGTTVNAQGAVPAQATGETFLRGGEVYLSVDVRSSSTDHNIEVRWLDPQGRVLHRAERHSAQGTPYVAFSSGRTARWRVGSHRAVILIDGRRVTEKPFSVI